MHGYVTPADQQGMLNLGKLVFISRPECSLMSQLMPVPLAFVRARGPH